MSGLQPEILSRIASRPPWSVLRSLALAILLVNSALGHAALAADEAADDGAAIRAIIDQSLEATDPGAADLENMLMGIQTKEGATQPGGTEGLAPAPVGQDNYKLDRGDRLRVKVYDRQDLTWEVRVSDRGEVRIPQVGAFNAIGKSLADVEDFVRTAIQNRIKRSTFVTVDLIEGRPFFVTGLVNKPGSYQFRSGLTVTHAIALAGGVYRSASGFLAADASRETAKMQMSAEELKRLIARHARLKTELTAAPRIPVPEDLVEMVGNDEATSLVLQEQEVMDRAAEGLKRDSDSLRKTIELNKGEITALELQLAQLDHQRQLRDKQLTDFKSLSSRGLVTQQRLIESQLAVSLLERDNQEAIANVARAKRNMEKTERDLDMLTIERRAKIEQDLVNLEELMAKAKVSVSSSRRVVQQITGLPASVQRGDTAEPTLAYSIMRNGPDGKMKMVPADEFTTLEPGDLLKVDPKQEGALASGTVN